MADHSWWETRTRPCLNSVSVTSMNLFQETTESTTTTTSSSSHHRGGGSGVFEDNPSLHMMELGLSSQPVSQSLDWNQTLYRGEQRNDDHQSGYQTLIQEDHGLSSNTSNFQENQWRPHKMYSNSPSEFKQINIRGYRLDERMDYRDENKLNLGFQSVDQSYGNSSTTIQSLFGSDNSMCLQQDSSYEQNPGMNYSYPSRYSGMTVSGAGGGEEYPPLPSQQEFSLMNPPAKVPPSNIATQLHFANKARFWNASATSMNDIRSSFFPLQMQSPSSTIEDKPKIPTSEMVKKSNNKSSSTKRPRNENQPLVPPLKVKMGDRITALQQLVSPFGKTDTASVLSEAILCIKFLHEQVHVLSTPYMKNAAIMQQQEQVLDKPSAEESTQDLRTRGLCLVPISSTFPVMQETTVDFWTPSFGQTFR